MPRPRKAAAAETAEIVLARKGEALPGEQTVDTAALDDAVQELNRLYVAKGLETARSIGEYVIARFFGGEPEKFHERSGGHVTFRELAERADLLPSHSFLWKACAVVEQLRLLPPNVAEALPFSHHALLLPVKDTAAKLQLAQKAVDKGLSKRALEAEVKKVRKRKEGETRAGRPALPVFVKGLTRLKAAVALATSEDVGADAFATYSPSKAKVLLEQLNEHVAALTELRSKVEAAMGEWERSTRA